MVCCSDPEHRGIFTSSSLRGADGKSQREVVMSQEEKPRFESCNPVITAADAALEAASEVLKDASADPWFHQKLMKAALEAALASIVIID